MPPLHQALVLAVSCHLFACVVGEDNDVMAPEDVSVETDSGAESDVGGPSGKKSPLLATTGPASATIRWAPNSETDLAGYIVYRGVTDYRQTGYYPVDAIIAMVRGRPGNASDSRYTNTGLPYATGYRYNVKAFDVAGNVSGWSPTIFAATGPGTMSTLSFRRDVWPILQRNCAGCHPKQAAVDTAYQRMMSTASGGYCDGRKLTVPGNAQASLVYQKVVQSDGWGSSCGGGMPSGRGLPVAEARIIGAWINQGALNN